jgi:hypothetical protein
MDISGSTIGPGVSIYSLNISQGDPYWANVSLLTATTTPPPYNNAGFVDSSTINATVSRVGSPVVTQGSFSPYPPINSVSYTAAVNGGSGLWPSNIAYLNIGSSNAAYAFGTGDFTVEGWMYFNSIPSSSAYSPMVQSDAVGSSTNNKWFFSYNNSKLVFATHSTGGFTCTTPWSPTTGVWYHVAVTRASGTIYLFINGVSGTVTTTGTPNGYDLGQNGISIGAMSSPYYFQGYLCDVRLVKGTAVYTGNFTTPTSPLTAISGTSLLLNFNSAGIWDSAYKNDITTANQGSSTTTYKWAPSSMKFLSGTEYISAPDSSQLQLGTGDFTVEGWVYLTTASTLYGIVNKGASTPTGWSVEVNASNQFIWYSGSTAIKTSTTTISAATWTYFAVTRSGTNLYLFVNGTLQGSAGTDSANYNQTDILLIGKNRSGDSLNGYLQNIRITKGVARYTATFTAPTAAFPTKFGFS